jgi:hypothetical protein
MSMALAGTVARAGRHKIFGRCRCARRTQSVQIDRPNPKFGSSEIAW